MSCKLKILGHDFIKTLPPLDLTLSPYIVILIKPIGLALAILVLVATCIFHKSSWLVPAVQKKWQNERREQQIATSR